MALKTILATLTIIASTAGLATGPVEVPAATDDVATRYCMKVEPVTGSRVETVECWTRAEWWEQGVDLDKDWPKEGVAIRRG